MNIARFVLAALAGASATIWLLFLAATFDPGYDGTGQLYWTGKFGGEFKPWYITILYLPPIITVLFSYLALRRAKSH